MDDRIKLSYFYGKEAEQYSFYKIPKLLFTDDYFKKISVEAKVLYGLMLDRMSLSVKNQWMDEEGRAYIYYSLEDIMDALRCSNKKAISIMKELDMDAGIGLNYTNNNNTEFNNTNPILSADEERMGYEAYLDEQLGIEALKADYPYDTGILDGIRELILDVICSKKKTIVIAGDEKPVNVVKGRFMKLDMEHIRYVMNCLQESTAKIRNIKQYLLAALYNAPATIDSYYRAEVSHDMAEGKI